MNNPFQKIWCPFCAGPIEFEVKDRGERVPCPHCGREILLESPFSGPGEAPRAFGFQWYSRKKTPAWQIPVLLALLIVGVIVDRVMRGGGSDMAGLFFSLVMLCVALGVYLLPTVVAAFRGHRNYAGVFLVNFFFGWTLIGWVAAMVWAVYNEREEKKS